MTEEIVFFAEESPEGGYTAQAMGESIYTQAETLNELKTQINDAISVHFDTKEYPRIIRLQLGKD